MSTWFGSALGGLLGPAQDQLAQQGQANAGQLGSLHQAWYNLQAQQQIKPERRVKFKTRSEAVYVLDEEIFVWEY